MRYWFGVVLIALPLVASADQDKNNRNVEAVITNQQRHQWDGWTRDPRGDYVPPAAHQPRTPSYGAPPIPQR